VPTIFYLNLMKNVPLIKGISNNGDALLKWFRNVI